MAASRSNSTDVTDNQSPNARVLGDATDHGRRSMNRTTCTCGNCKMHDQDFRSLCELDESRVGTGLIGAEYYRHIPCLHAVRQSREIAVRYSQRGHGHSLPVEHYRRFCFRHIDDADIETNASPRLALRGSQRGTEHLEGATLLIEEATEEHREGGATSLPEGPTMGNGSLRA